MGIPTGAAIWFPVNYLIIESLQKFDYYFGDSFQVDFPTGSGQRMELWDVAAQLSRRMARLVRKKRRGRRPVYGGTER